MTDAARVLGVSTRTIRRHIKDGKLTYTKIDGQFGPEYRITELPVVPKPVNPSPTSAEWSGSFALDMIRRLEEENRNMAGQLGIAHEKIRNLEGQLKMLVQPKKPWWKRLFRG